VADSYFSKALVYIHQHNRAGAQGLVVNMRLPIALSDILEHLEIPVSEESYAHKLSVLSGGPVSQEQGFILHRNRKWPGTVVDKSTGVRLSTSKDVLRELATQEPPMDVQIFLGYSGWDSGQLEEELIQTNSWIITPATPDIIFATPIEQRLAAAAATIGITLDQLSSDVGHA
jgi:putative transcriptional regulator